MAAESDPSSLLKGVRGVVFDMDGSLTQPDAIDFQRLRRRLGIAADQGILEAIEAEVSQVRRGEMMDIVHEEEERGLEAMALMDGAAALLDALDAAGVKRGLITRNSERAMERTLGELGCARGVQGSTVYLLTRRPCAQRCWTGTLTSS